MFLANASSSMRGRRRCPASTSSRASSSEMSATPLPFEIAVDELARRRDISVEDQALAVLDVREPWEVEICRLPDSINIPLALLPGQLGTLPRHGTLVARERCCKRGQSDRRN